MKFEYKFEISVLLKFFFLISSIHYFMTNFNINFEYTKTSYLYQTFDEKRVN